MSIPGRPEKFIFGSLSISASANRQARGPITGGAMKFLCLVCSEPPVAPVSDAEMEERFAAYFAFNDRLRKNGHYVGCNRLQPANTAVTVRVRDGKVMTTDGPF